MTRRHSRKPPETRPHSPGAEEGALPSPPASPVSAAEDRAFWHLFLQGVTPLPGREPPEPARPPPSPPSPPPPALRGRGERPVAVAFPPLVIELTPRGLDRARQRRLQNGLRREEVREIDLHGETLESAFRRFRAALADCLAAGIRILDVITGHGRSGQGGAIHRELPHWLNRADIRPLVIAAFRVHPANPGATRLLLRRRQRILFRHDGGSGSETV